MVYIKRKKNRNTLREKVQRDTELKTHEYLANEL